MPLPDKTDLNEYKIVSPVTGRAYFVTGWSRENAERILVARLALMTQRLVNKEAA